MFSLNILNFSCPADYIGANCSENYDLCERTSPCIGGNSNCSVNETGGIECSCETGSHLIRKQKLLKTLCKIHVSADCLMHRNLFMNLTCANSMSVTSVSISSSDPKSKTEQVKESDKFSC